MEIKTEQERRSILITGGSSGLGAETARRLLGAGHRVAVTGRDAGRLRAFATSVGAPECLLTIESDATDMSAVDAAVAATVARFGRLDVAIANAGFSTHDTLETGDPEKWREMVLTNVFAPALLVKASLRSIRASKGRFVFLGSVAGFRNAPGNMYVVTKWAMTALAENTRLLVAADGVGVTLIAPGRVDTAFWGERGKPEGPMLTAAEVAETIAWVIAQPPNVDVNTVIVRPIGQVA
jgi:NADP-dependent 3-hydroxy acid dehydrogenase YdfG